MGRHVPSAADKIALNWRPIIREICARHGVAWREVIGNFRDPRIVACRHEIWWTIHERFGTAFQQIGARTGGFDRSTVSVAVRGWLGRRHLETTT